MGDNLKCTECGIEFFGNSAGELCPKCLLGLGLQVGAGCQLRVRCPHCHNPVEVVDEPSLDEFTCPSCDSRFTLLGDETRTFDRASAQTIGQFELLDCVGTGGFGSVWKARDRELDRIVAVKIPRTSLLGPEEAEQFFREARAAAQLRHPNIVSVHEIGKADNQIYIVSDFVDGVTLADSLAAKSFTVAEAAKLCQQVADALSHAHEQGVVHRDIKPSNILLDRTHSSVNISDFDSLNEPSRRAVDEVTGPLVPHITDFGLARRDSGEITITVDGRVLGTPAYMPPEQARGTGHLADARSDIYSLGVVLYEMLTGEKPFRGSSRMLIDQVLHDDPPQPRKLNRGIPTDLETICLKCMEKEPARRYHSASFLSADLGRFLGGEPVHARPITSLGRLWRWARRNPRVAGLTAATAAALLLGITATSWQWRSTERAREAESTQRQKAVAAANQLNRQLVNSFVTEGNRCAELEDFFMALPFYIHAMTIDYRSDKELHRRRINGLIDRLPRLEHVWHFGEPILDAGFSPDGSRLAVSTLDSTVRVIRVADRKEMFLLKHDQPVYRLSFENGGKTLFCLGGQRRSLRRLDLWDLETGERLAAPVLGSPDDSRPRRLEIGDYFAAEDGWLFTLEWAEGRDHYRWVLMRRHLSAPEKVEEICGGTTTYNPPLLISSGDQKSLALIASDAILVDVENPEATTIAFNPGYSPTAVLNEDGSRMAFSSGSSVSVWNTETGEKIGTVSRRATDARFIQLAFNDDGLALRALDDWGQLRMMNLGRSMSGLSNRSSPHLGSRTSWISPDMSLVAYEEELDEQSSAYLQSNGIRVWNTVDQTRSPWRIYHRGKTIRCDFHPRRPLLVSCGDDGLVKLWNLGVSPATLPALDHPYLTRLNRVEYHPRSNYPVAIFEGIGLQNAAQYPSSTADIRRTPETDIYEDFTGSWQQPVEELFPVAAGGEPHLRVDAGYELSPENKTATVTLKCTYGDQVRWTWQHDEEPFFTSRFNHFHTAVCGDGSTIAFGIHMTRRKTVDQTTTFEKTSKVMVFDAETGSPIGLPLEFTGELIGLNLDHSGSRLLVSSGYFPEAAKSVLDEPQLSRVQMIDIASGQPVFPSIERKRPVRGVFSNSGRFLAIGGAAGELSIHNAASGVLQFPVIRLHWPVKNVIFDSNDTMFAANCIGHRKGFAMAWESESGLTLLSRIPCDNNSPIRFVDKDRKLQVLDDRRLTTCSLDPEPLPANIDELSQAYSLHRIDQRGILVEMDFNFIQELSVPSRSAARARGRTDQEMRQATLEKALACYDRRYWSMAIDNFSRLELMEPDEWLWKWYLGKCLSRSGADADRVSQTWNQAIALAPDEPAALQSRAVHHIAHGQWGLAAEDLWRLHVLEVSPMAGWMSVIALGSDKGGKAFVERRRSYIEHQLPADFAERDAITRSYRFDVVDRVCEMALLEPVDHSRLESLYPAIARRFKAHEWEPDQIHLSSLSGDREPLHLTNYLWANLRLDREQDASRMMLENLVKHETSDSPRFYYLLALANIQRGDVDGAKTALDAGQKLELPANEDRNDDWFEARVNQCLRHEIQKRLASGGGR